MKRLIILTGLMFFSFNAHSVILNPNMELRPLCFSDNRSCSMASRVLNLPPRGNFQVKSQCRYKTQIERQNGVCYGWNGVLGVSALINLPQIGQFQMRNQCYFSMSGCQDAAQIWNQLSHPYIDFSMNCAPYNKAAWVMTPQQMMKNGIYSCVGRNKFELRIKATRIR